MYDENSMKSHIFWIKFRRVFLLLLFTVIGTTLGVVISDYVVNILLFPTILRTIIVAASAVLFLALALLLTANTGKEIEDCYWKIAIYKTLNIISQKIEHLEHNETVNSVQSDATFSNDSDSTIVTPPTEASSDSNNKISETPESSEEVTSNTDDNKIIDDTKNSTSITATEETDSTEKTEIKSDSENN